MPGGKRNPFSMTQMLETIGDAVQNAKTKAEPHSTMLASVLGKVEHKTEEVRAELAPGAMFVDLSIQVCTLFVLWRIVVLNCVVKFIGASGLPKMDVVGTADPYFIAKIDKRVSFVYVIPRSFVSCSLPPDTPLAQRSYETISHQYGTSLGASKMYPQLRLSTSLSWTKMREL